MSSILPQAHQPDNFFDSLYKRVCCNSTAIKHNQSVVVFSTQDHCSKDDQAYQLLDIGLPSVKGTSEPTRVVTVDNVDRIEQYSID